MDDIELEPIPKKKAKKSKAEIELDKMLNEAKAADAKIAAEEASKPIEIPEAKSQLEQQKPEQPVQKQPEEKSDFLKWFFVGLIVVSLVGGYLIYSQLHPNTNIITPTTGLAVYNPQNLLKGWQLTSSGITLAEMEPALRTEMMSQGVTDVAVWEFGKSKSDEKLYFWTRIYQDNETRNKYDGIFNGPLVWRNGLRANIAAGDEGIVGVYRTAAENDPLMVYIAQGKQIWYISYYNYVNVNGSAYNATNMDADKQFLVNLGREFYNSFQTAAS